jgi:NTE family protein
MNQAINNKSVALVLASGGARGVAHIGVIEELEKRGYKIHSVAGSSIGSVIGGLYAAGKLTEYADWIKTLSKIDVYRLMDFTFNMGFVKADKVFEEIKKFTGEWQIEDLPINTSIVSVDIKTRKEIVFTSGDLFTAIRASIAYPTVITPLKHDNMLLVDGGVLNPIPVNRVKRNDGDILIAVDLSAAIPYPKAKKERKHFHSSHLMTYSQVKKILSRWSKEDSSQKNRDKWSYFRLMEESLLTMHRQISDLTLENNKVDLLIPISHECADLFEFYRAEELIEYGRQQAIIALDKFEAKL